MRSSAMNGGPLPPVPDLIPIAALRKDPIKRQKSNEKVRQQSCAPNSTRGEVMGEQRSRRTGKQPAVDLIDSVQSRGASAAPQARKARSERHRKSDRRREHKGGRKRSSSKHRSRSSKQSSSPERHPRVNPIFVWVRQEDTHIVDVKCEDYDKRNRILLTKTAQGWRAIPRTETLVPSLREADDQGRQHRIRKARKSCKVKRKSTAVQVDEDMTETVDVSKDSPTWTTPVNIESHLPSHTIHIPKKRCASEDRCLEADDISSVNSGVDCSAQTQNVKCSASKSCDVTSPLDNLLAVAELEFNHQIQTGEWDKSTVMEGTEGSEECAPKTPYESTEESKEYLESMTQLNNLIDRCTNDNQEEETGNIQDHFDDQKIEECDYNEEDENNIVMDDILSRLEQSLQSPDNYHEQSQEVGECNSTEEVTSKQHQLKESEVDTSEMTNEKDFHETVPDPISYFEQKEAEPEKEKYPTDYEESDVLVGSSTNTDVNEDVPTDLTISKSNKFESYDDMIPTDLSIPKNKTLTPLRPLTPPSPSQNSETIQSPQPSGIPAVPPSPDIFNCGNNKSKSVFLESLLTTANQKVALNSEVTLTRQKEPLDLGKCRKSASPTVTCSEEVKNNSVHSDMEPLAKKFKIEDITLKTLLDPELMKANAEAAKAKNTHPVTPETPRLLELLTSDAELDALTQLKQVLADVSLKVPDPMLVPKDRLSLILSSPAKEIPKLLKQRPELRLPEALAYPHLLQDPDILVITLSQLQTIIQKQCQPLPLKDSKSSGERSEEKPKDSGKRDSVKETACNSNSKQKSCDDDRAKLSDQKKDAQPRASMNELANDIDAATNAAFNQMMWLPYLNQLEAAAATFGNSPDFMKMLSTMLPMYSGQVPDVSHLFNNRIPPPVGFPLQPPVNYNPLEYSMWQEAIMQANMLRPKNPFETFGTKNNYRECMDRAKAPSMSKKPSVNQKHSHMPPLQNNNPFYMPNMHSSQTIMHNSFVNMPGSFSHGNTGQNLQIPQYNPLLNQQSSVQERKANSQLYASKNQYAKYDHKALTSGHIYPQHRSQVQHHTNQKLDPVLQRTKFQSKNPAMSGRHKSPPKDITRKHEDASKQSTQPIDLSGSTNSSGSKLKVRQHLIDQVNAPKLLKHDDAPEVGSTTASIEEMQESQKHLWHPLFGK